MAIGNSARLNVVESTTDETGTNLFFVGPKWV